MANTNAPFGFKQVSGNGSAPTYEQVERLIAYNASAIYNGDPVTAVNDGTIARSSSTGASPAALGIAGIFVGCKYLSVSQKRTVWSNYWPGTDAASTTKVYGSIINDPNAIFVAQSDSTGLALADVGLTIGFVIGTGSTDTGQSGAYLDVANATTTANFPFRVIEVVNNIAGYPGSLANGQAYDWAYVAFNNVNTRNFTGV